MAKRKAKIGRPKVDPGKAFTRRHVLNISPELEKSLLTWSEDNGVGKLADAMRQLLLRALKAEEKP